MLKSGAGISEKRGCVCSEMQKLFGEERSKPWLFVGFIFIQVDITADGISKPLCVSGGYSWECNKVLENLFEI